MKVRTVNLRLLLTSLALPILVGIAGALVTASGMDAFELLTKPPLVPPAWVFSVVWTILYILMGVAVYNVRISNSYNKSEAMQYFYIQLALNFLWVVTFFRFGWLWVSVIVLLALIVAIALTIKNFGQISSTAARLMLPYLLWCLFALYLNIGYAVLN